MSSSRRRKPFNIRHWMLKVKSEIAWNWLCYRYSLYTCIDVCSNSYAKKLISLISFFNWNKCDKLQKRRENMTKESLWSWDHGKCENLQSVAWTDVQTKIVVENSIAIFISLVRCAASIWLSRGRVKMAHNERSSCMLWAILIFTQSFVSTLNLTSYTGRLEYCRQGLCWP